MNKIPCDVIKDLIILYEDDSCSEESKKIVEEHIRGCSDCQEFYEEATTPLPAISSEPEANGEGEISTEEKAMKFLKKLKRHEDFKSVMTILIAVAAIWLICAGYNWFSVTHIPAPSQSVTVSELYRLKNGYLFCTLESDKPFTQIQLSDVIVPQDKLSQNYDNGWYEVSLDTAWWKKLNPNTIQHTTLSILFPMSSSDYDDYNKKTIIHKSEAIYYTGKDKNDRLTIWQSGQPIKDAPETIENHVKIGRAHV